MLEAMESSSKRLLSIGQFAAATGLSPATLRHYDEVGLLNPSFVDPATGYRWYSTTQGRRADLIRRLRGVKMPVKELARLLEAIGDAEALGSLLDSHRERLTQAVEDATNAHEQFNSISEEIIAMTDIAGPQPILGPVSGIRILCKDLKRARQFYSERLRLQEQHVSSDWIVYDASSVLLILESDAADEARRGGGNHYSGFSFAVDDIDAVCAILEANDVKIVGHPEKQEWGGTLAHFSDPDGKVLTLVQYPEPS